MSPQVRARALSRFNDEIPTDASINFLDEPIQFGLPRGEGDTMPKVVAKRRYLLLEEDLARLKPVPHENKIVYNVEDLERACLRRWGSEKEFRREQLRREIRRRRRVNRYDLSDLPWDPALGRVPVYDASADVVGRRAVHTAIATNGIVLVSKLVAFVYTGSASVLSECVHSIADFGNQCLLAVGIAQSLREADASHPYGYATDRYVWSLISGVGIFFLGCGVSVYHGISGLLQPHEIENFQIGMGVLGIAFVVEGYSFWIAVKECRMEAKKANLTLREYILEGSDAMNVAVLMEDGVAVGGCGIAASCLYASQLTGNPLFDSFGSIAIGSLLGFVAIILIRKNRNLLVGSALPEKRISRVIEMLENDPVVSSVHDVKAIIIGADRGRFKAEINFDAKTLARRSIQRCRRCLQSLQSNLSPTEVENVMLTYSTEMLAQIGDEVDRLEGMIRRELPEIRHVDLEIL